MGRLTGRDKEGTYLKPQGCAKGEKVRCTDYREFINAHYGKQLLDKLAEFEDFMEENEINDLEELEDLQGKYAYECECNKQFVQCQNELQAYKKAWKELKKYINAYQEDFTWKNTAIYDAQEDFIDKMHELEPNTEGKDEE